MYNFDGTAGPTITIAGNKQVCVAYSLTTGNVKWYVVVPSSILISSFGQQLVVLKDRVIMSGIYGGLDVVDILQGDGTTK